MERLPGPMLGSFDSYSEALFAACRKIFTKPRSSAGRRPPETALREEQDAFNLRRQVATEYCAWIYYTPEGKYEISLLTDQSIPDPTGAIKRCTLPYFVEDRRYPPDAIKYIFVIHNHTFDTPISEFDVRYIVSQGLRHSFQPGTKDGDLLLSSVAFFSNGRENPTCDGYYMYTPYVGKILKWSRDDQYWSCEQTHVIKWMEGESFDDFEIKEEKASCPNRGAP